MSSNLEVIAVRGAKEHNLKNINVDIPKDKLVVITGLSGSGKSSLAFDTIHAEGKRRYLESLSTYAKQFEIYAKPNVESITGLSPSIAIDQKTTSKNPRSTVATITEIYDYLRILFARIGIPYSPATGLPIEKQSAAEIAEKILALPENTKIQIVAPIVIGQKGEHRKELIHIRKQGFKHIKVDDIFYTFDELPVLDKNKKHTIEVLIDKLVLTEQTAGKIHNLIDVGIKLGGNGVIYVEIISEDDKASANKIPEAYARVEEKLVFSENFACPVSGFSLTEIEPRIFSFNSPYGACAKCEGLGVEKFFSPSLVIPDPSLSLNEGAIAPWVIGEDNKYDSVTQQRFYNQIFEALAGHYNFSLDTPFDRLPQQIQDMILYGTNFELITFHYSNEFRKSTTKAVFEGVIPSLEKKLEKAESNYVIEKLELYRDIQNCTACNGYRLKPESLCVKIAGKHVGEVCAISIKNAIEWFENLPATLDKTQGYIAEKIIQEISKRLVFLSDIGLNYLTLNRKSATLSGGESQRIRLAIQISSGLSGIVYVLDEPSIGLHQSDNHKLLIMLRNLRNLGNTVIVVEHDEDTIRAADYLIDIGVGAGLYGGSLVALGSVKDIADHPDSITGQYLSGKLRIELPEKRRQFKEQKYIELVGARANNLKNISIKIPLGQFIVVTGVSGSGKSTFVVDTLYKIAAKKLHKAHATTREYDSISGLEYIDKVIEVDQSPIGRTPRSNPATYTNAFTAIREWFASLSEAKVRGYNASRFSFNVKGGRCEACEGDGVLKIEMYFLPDVYIVCEECKGQRYNNETLQIKYKNYTISDVLNMTADDASEFFRGISVIYEKLVTLQEVGLGYIKIGQSAVTLSGGEAQRVKLAKELARKCTGRTLYILDEPTTGLHVDDIRKLLKVLHRLVESGNTVIVIEHNLDVIKTADHIIDFGPQGGDMGGYVVAFGTPEEVAVASTSITGQYLQNYLKR
ncbi:excision nuclease subunit A [Alphaproteobacteria bacterium]